ncbi:MAG: 16S rRNA (cytosine(1402)-N(4))-methyltransferase RsmH [Deltaproteobacteria bacterium]|nr:16S rRNA (cytosine(1402)-N(4))-methyltransferase RsmH [Deltaproteobacteria bacterium]
MPGEHIPVLLQEILEWLAPAPGEAFLDGTVGAGGHAAAIAARIGPDGILVGSDADPAMLSAASERLRGFPGVRLVLADFAELPRLREAAGGRAFDGILLDLGLSSIQLDDPTRGFSFREDGPLDMRRDPASEGPTAAELLRRRSERELADIFYRLGEERFSRRIARAVVARRRRDPIERTGQLADLVAAVIPRKAWPRAIHPATRVFQALRIAVNGELDSLAAFLSRFPEHLAPGGRVAVISFHSLEDRMVKEAFRTLAAGRGAFTVLTRKPVVPRDEEIAVNPRSRSARLRAVRRSRGEEATCRG